MESRGFLQTAGSQAQRQKSQKQTVCAEIPHLGIPEERMFIAPHGQKRPWVPSVTMTLEGDDSPKVLVVGHPLAVTLKTDCPRVQVCASRLTAPTGTSWTGYRICPRPSGQA